MNARQRNLIAERGPYRIDYDDEGQSEAIGRDGRLVLVVENDLDRAIVAALNAVRREVAAEKRKGPKMKTARRILDACRPCLDRGVLICAARGCDCTCHGGNGEKLPEKRKGKR